MNKQGRAILYGMAVGDGYISYRKRKREGSPYVAASLTIGHGPKQREYLEHKRDLMVSVLGGKHNKISKCKHDIGENTYYTYRWSRTDKYFRQMHRNLYATEKKVVTEKVLSYLDEHSLALWFLDAGTIRSNKNKQGEVTSLGFELCTQCNTPEEAALICKWLQDRFGIDCRVYIMKGRYNIRGATQGTLVLCSIIEPYVPSSMAYKIIPSFRFVYRKSAKHPNFMKDDDIVQAT